MKAHKCLLVTTLIFLDVFAFGQNSVKVQIIRPRINQNFDGKLSNLLEIGDQLQATVQQLTGRESKRVNLMATLANQDQSVQILARTNTAIQLDGTIPYNLFGSNLTNFFSEGSIETIGLDRNDLLTGGFVPEGFYKLCVVVFDADIADGYTSQLSESNIGSCLNLKTQYAEPPRLTLIGGQPIVDASESVVVPFDPMPFVIQWSPAIVAGGGVTYKLQIADMGDMGQNSQVGELDPNTAFDNNPFAIVEKSGLSTTSVTVGTAGQLNVVFEASHRYAVRVQAQTITNGTIKNSGYSQVASFWFGESGTQATAKRAPGTSVALTAYPQQGYMPYLGMPVVVRLGDDFDPTKENIIQFKSDFQISKEGGGTVVLPRRLKWFNRSPRETQQILTDASPPLTTEQARRIAISHASNDKQVYKDFYITNMTRGKSYNWNASITLTERTTKREVDIEQDLSGGFIFGMDKPLPAFPENKSNQEKGDITFKYKTANRHDITGMMLHDIVQKEDDKPLGSFDVSVSEKAILEVSTLNDFSKTDSIKFRSAPVVLKKVLLNSSTKNEQINWDVQLAFLYKEEQATFNFTKDGTYYWRIKWLKNPDSESDTTSYNSSEIWQFTIGDDSVPENTSLFDRPPLAEVACENCETVVLPTGATKSIKVGDYVKVGHFVMEVSEISGSAGGPYSGKATMLDFSLMGYSARLNVSFTDLRAVAYVADGKNYLQATTGKTETLSRGSELLTLVELINDQPLSLPLGVDFTMSGHHVVLKLDKITFLPTKATALAKAAWEPPLDIADGQPFAVSAREVCLLPGRFGNEATFVLDQNIMVNQGSAYEFSFTGDPSGSNYANATFLQFKCDTVSVQLAGQLTFPRTVLLPENGHGKIIEGADKVSGLFKLRFDRYAHIDKINEPSVTETGMIAQIGFSGPFQIADLDGWGFTVTNASLDLSDLANPNNMEFPNGYVYEPWFPANSPPSMRNLWRGIYCKDVLVRIPKDLTQHDDDDESAQFGIENLIIDKTGVSVSIAGENVLALGSAKWDFTIDQIALSVIQTKTFSGTLNGRLRLPNFDPGNFLDYDMMVTTADNKPAYACNIRVKEDPLKMSLWLLDVKLDQTSYIKFELGRKEPGKSGLRLKGELNGYLGLQSNPVMDNLDDLMDMKLNEVKFEKFGFDTDSSGFFTFKHINWTEREGEANPVMAFASPQHSAGRLPISITGFDFVNEEGKPGLKIGAELNLSDMGFKAAIGLTIFGNVEIAGVIPTNVSYDHIRLDTIRIACDFSGFDLKGEVIYYNTGGDKGYKGNIAVTMPMSLSGRLTAQFGSRGEVAAAGYYRYWFVDGMVYLKDGIPISPALELRAFGGGAWYHMTMANPNAMDREAAAIKAQEIYNSGEPDNPDDVPPSGITYVADQSAGLGLSVAAVLALQGDETVFNMDVAIKVEFNADWGLRRAGIVGNGYLLQDLDKREDPSIKATVDLFYNHNGGDWNFTGNLEVMVDMAGVLVGSGPNKMAGQAQLYFDHTGKWYFKLGTLQQRIGLTAKIGDALQIVMNSYLMVGHDIPTELPPLPAFISNLLSGPSGDTGNLLSGTALSNDNRPNRAADMDKYKTGKGFAFGASTDFEYDNTFLFFYAKMRLAIGYDINITKPYTAVICGENGPRGFKGGWYGQGQAYAGFEGEFGIEVDLWIISGRFALAEVGAAIAMNIKLPNPTYFDGRAGLRYSLLGGRVKGECNYRIELGEKCDDGGNPFNDVQFISEMSPDDGSAQVSPSAQVATAFNFAMGREFELEVQKEGEQNATVHRFIPFLSKYELFKTKKTGGETLIRNLEDSEFKNENILAVLAGGYLSGETQHRAYVEVRVNEIKGGNPELVKLPNGDPFTESRKIVFTTGPLPDSIELVNAESWPIVNQRYFLQNVGLEPHPAVAEYTGPINVGKKGYLRMGQGYLFNNTEFGNYKSNKANSDSPALTMPNGREVSYVAEFTPVSVRGEAEGPVVKKNVAYHDENGSDDPNIGAIEFEIPTLQNSTRYKLAIKRYIRTGAAISQLAMSVETNTVTKNYSASKGRGTPNGKGGAQAVDATAIFTVNKIQGTTGTTAEPPEYLLTSYVFQTSKYNTHREKLSGTFSPEWDLLTFGRVWSLDSGEPFEVGELPTSLEQAAGAQGLGKGPMFEVRLPDWNTYIATNSILHPKFSRYYRWYKQYFRYESPVTKTFSYNTDASSGQLNAALTKYSNSYLKITNAGNGKIETKAVISNHLNDESSLLIRHPYIVVSALKPRLETSVGPPQSVKASSVALNASASNSAGPAQSPKPSQFGAAPVLATAAGSGSPQVQIISQVNPTPTPTSGASGAFANAGVGAGESGTVGTGNKTMIFDQTDPLMRERLKAMSINLMRFRTLVPQNKELKYEVNYSSQGFGQPAVSLEKHLSDIKPLTAAEWNDLEAFFESRPNIFSFHATSMPPYQYRDENETLNQFTDKSGRQPIEFIFWVPTKNGSYRTSPIRMIGNTVP